MSRSFANSLLKACLLNLILLASSSSSLVSAEFRTINLTGRLQGATLEYQVNRNDPNAWGFNTITIRYIVQKSCWLGVGISPDGSMINSEVVIVKPLEQTIRKHKITGKSAQAIVMMENSGLLNATFRQSGGVSTLMYTKFLEENGELPIDPNGPNTFVAAYGRNNTFGYHEAAGSFVVNLATDGIEPTPPAPAPPTAAPVDGFRQVPLGDGAIAETNFQYRLNRADETVSIRFTCPGNSWVGVGVSRDFGKMIPAKSVIGYPGSGEAPLQYWMQAQETSGVVPLADQVLTDAQIEYTNDETTLSYTIPVYDPNTMADDTLEVRADGRLTNFILACGFNAGPSFHRVIGSFDTVITDGGAPIFPSPTIPPVVTPTNAPVPTVPSPATGGFRQIYLGGSLSDPFEYRLNRNDANANGADTISIRFTCPGNVWVGVGASRDYGVMVPSKSVIGFPGSGNPPRQYLMEGRNASAVNPLPDDQQVLIDPQVTFANDKTTLSYTMPLYTTGMATPDETLEIRADGQPESFIIACGLNAAFSIHRVTGSLIAQLLDGTAPPTASPIAQPTAAPVMGPTTPAPVPLPTSAPVPLPTTASPVAPPTAAPVMGPTTSAPVPAPTSAPIPPPTTVSPIGLSPTNAPVMVPTTDSPIGPAPTDAPVMLPTNSPIGSTPTNAPVLSFTDSPIGQPPTTDGPVESPTDTPVTMPTDAPAVPTASLAPSGIGRISLGRFVLVIMIGIACQNLILG